MARDFAEEHSLDPTMPNTSVIVKDERVIGIGANGSNYHQENGCERVRLNSPSGKDYDKCEGCSPKNHGEQQAIKNIVDGQSLAGAEVYLWGHWWCCQSCWQAMLDQGINTVYLLDGSEKLFNKDDPENVVGHQFDQ